MSASPRAVASSSARRAVRPTVVTAVLVTASTVACAVMAFAEESAPGRRLRLVGAGALMAILDHKTALLVLAIAAWYGAQALFAKTRPDARAVALLAGFAGGTLVWWALTGEGDLSQARNWFTRVVGRARQSYEDLVDDASAGSFPASDPPAHTATVGTGLRRSPTTR